jgi:hypothetical protein
MRCGDRTRAGVGLREALFGRHGNPAEARRCQQPRQHAADDLRSSMGVQIPRGPQPSKARDDEGEKRISRRTALTPGFA